MSVPSCRAPFVLVLVSAIAISAPLSAQTDKKAAPSNELDAFMEKVLVRRDENRLTLNQYILDETEGFELLGPGRYPLFRQKREFTWYVRDGIHVRSPVRFDGVGIDEQARDRYEQRWIARERGRREEKAKERAERENRRRLERDRPR